MGGGLNWGVLADVLLSDMQDPLSTAVFFLYLAFIILAFLNIINGACVDTAVETGRTQRDLLMQKELDFKEQYTRQMRSLFRAMDTTGTGRLNYEEFHEHMQDPRVQCYLYALGLDTSDVGRLFGLLDTDNSADVDVEEFLVGCLRLKGNARSIDVYAMMRDLKLLDIRVEELCIAVDKLLPFL